MKHETLGQKILLGAIAVITVVAVAGAISLNIWAIATCAPQYGKWTPWTGKICYGDRKLK